MPGELVALRFSAKVEPPGEGWSGRLYRPADRDWPAREHRSVEAVTIPYYAWANRTPGQMRVWLRGD